MSTDEQFSIKSILRKRSSTPRKNSLKSEIRNLIDKQRQDIQEAGAHLIWKRSSEQSLKYDVIIVIPPKGFHLIDSILQLINEKLPNLVVDIKPHSHNKEQAFYITANDDYLLTGAKLLGFHHLQQTLTSLQRQTIILHFLNSLRWIKSDIKSNTMEHEFKSLKLSDGEALIPKLIKLNLIKQVLPLHNESDLSQLRVEWVSAFFSIQPLDKICHYFGVKIAIYFAFLGFYTLALIFPAILGILITIIGNNDFFGEVCILAFTVINIIWSTVFLQKWKHSNKKLIQKWSSMHFGTTVNFMRPLFRGNIIHTNSFGCIQIEYPEWKRQLFKYLVTLPIIGFSLLSVFGVMIAVFEFQNWWDDFIIVQSGYPLWTSYLPKILLAIIISIFDSIYYQIAIWLNNKENYQFETVHENNLILKLILFEFVNSFLPVLYIAFYIGDMDKLREQLAALLITRQVIGNIKESILPFIMESYKLSPKISGKSISQGELEASMFRYDSTFDDYLELVVQFGYVLLFSSTFPLAALCALINNLIEIRSDAFKLCVVFQRPFASEMVRDIGEWENVMNCLVYAAILVNCALIAKTKQITKILPIEDPVHVVIISVVIEHLLLAIKWLSPFII